jgi:hypothetical protein
MLHSSMLSPLLVDRTISISLLVEAVPVIELDALLFQQALLECVAAIAGGGVGHLAFPTDNAMPRKIGCRVKVLEYAADKAGVPCQPGHRGDLAIRWPPSLQAPSCARITRIAPVLNAQPGATVEEGEGEIALPGFVEAHTDLDRTMAHAGTRD